MIAKILNQLARDNNELRKTSQENRMSMYLDNYEDLILTKLKTQFSKENQDVLYPMVALHDNVFKAINNLKAKTYKDSPNREWVVNNEADESYNDLILKSNLDSESIRLEKFSFINNIAFMRAKIVYGKLCYEAIAPEYIDIEQDPQDPWKFNALVHTIVKNATSGEHTTAYHVWTNGKSSIDEETMPNGYMQTVYLDSEGVERGGEKIPNPYIDPETQEGIIPYVEMRTVMGVDYWSETMNNDLYEGTLQINVKQTHSNNLKKYSGYRQLFISGGQVDTAKLQNQKSDVASAIVVSGVVGQSEPTIQAVEHSNDPNVLDRAINGDKAQLAQNHGVSFNAEAMSGNQRQTAEAMTISRQQLMEIRKEVLPLFREYEKNLAKITVIIANTPQESGLGLNIDITGEFRIDYVEPKVVSSPKEELETDLLKISQGVMSKAQLLMKLNPDIKSEEDAIERLEKIKEINEGQNGIDNEIANAVQGINVTQIDG